MAALALQPLILEGAGWADYGLVDSGHGRKLERYGPYRFIRPEGQALWSPRLPEWRADGEFVPGSDEDGGGRWHFARPVPEDGWPLSWNEVRFTAQCTPFRHLGFFPDMAPVWDWMREVPAAAAVLVGAGNKLPIGLPVLATRRPHRLRFGADEAVRAVAFQLAAVA